MPICQRGRHNDKRRRRQDGSGGRDSEHGSDSLMHNERKKDVKNIRIAVVCLSVPVLLAGCATLTVVDGPRIEEATGTFPETAKTVSAAVGDVVFSQYQYWRKTGIRLNRAAEARIGGGVVQVQEGDFLTKAIVDGKEAYCTEKPSFRMLVGGKTACFVDAAGKGDFDQVKVASEVAWWSANLSAPLPYSAGELVVPRSDAKKAELIYQGFSKQVLRLAYREYVSDMARPAFFQDLTYEVSSFPAEIRFKQVHLRIISAGNSGVDYELLSTTPLR